MSHTHVLYSASERFSPCGVPHHIAWYECLVAKNNDLELYLAL